MSDINEAGGIIDFGAGNFVHLGLGATVVPLPTHTGGMEWYVDYERRHGDDGVEGRLVSMHTFDGSWDTWEVHPNGSELVLCVDGRMVLTQEHPDGSVDSVEVGPGQAIVNAPGVWHTADLPEGTASATAVFVTAGAGTELRPR